MAYDVEQLLAMTQTIALMNLLESREEETDAVSLSTLHAAKGLEFGHVFMVGVEEGVLPHERSETPEQIEEERRLMYVGITRAQRSLQISYCNKRRRGKEWQNCEASRFLQELPTDDVIFAGAVPAGSTPEVSKDEGMAKLARLKAMSDLGKGAFRQPDQLSRSGPRIDELGFGIVMLGNVDRDGKPRRVDGSVALRARYLERSGIQSELLAVRVVAKRDALGCAGEPERDMRHIVADRRRKARLGVVGFGDKRMGAIRLDPRAEQPPVQPAGQRRAGAAQLRRQADGGVLRRGRTGEGRPGEQCGESEGKKTSHDAGALP